MKLISINENINEALFELTDEEFNKYYKAHQEIQHTMWYNIKDLYKVVSKYKENITLDDGSILLDAWCREINNEENHKRGHFSFSMIIKYAVKTNE